MRLRKCEDCERVWCGRCSWKGVRKRSHGLQVCGRCGSDNTTREASRHVLGGRCRYARDTNVPGTTAEVRDACTEGEGRMAVGNGGEGVSHEEGGAATGAGDQAVADGGAPAGAEGVAVEQETVRSGVCGECWIGVAEDNHEVCNRASCTCSRCATVKDEVARTPLPRWTVDANTKDQDSLKEAMAFRKPNGDTLAVMRTALCPSCGGVAVLFLADGDVVSFVRTSHGSCDMKPARD